MVNNTRRECLGPRVSLGNLPRRPDMEDSVWEDLPEYLIVHADPAEAAPPALPFSPERLVA